MNQSVVARFSIVGAVIALVVAIGWLDQNRAGPVTRMSGCNLALTRSSAPPADVLLVGSSRLGAALDPVMMGQILSRESGNQLRVERLAIGNNPLRTMAGLSQSYLDRRGAPRVIVLEVMTMSQRSMALRRDQGTASPEDARYKADANLLEFHEILGQQAVAMPFTTPETRIYLWSQKARGVLLRSGALLYQFLRDPTDGWDLDACEERDFTREPSWREDLAFALAEYDVNAPVDEVIANLEQQVVGDAPNHAIEEGQTSSQASGNYAYDLEEDYRRGEVILIKSVIEKARARGTQVVLLPLPLSGYTIDAAEFDRFTKQFDDGVRWFDLYDAIEPKFDTLWVDDAHVQSYPVGALGTSILALEILKSGLVKSSSTTRE